MDPFSGSTQSIDLDGVVTARKVWGGRAELEEIEADGPKMEAKTWQPSFNANLTREKPAPDPDDILANLDAAHLNDRQTDFDFDLGTWSAHSTRLLNPLTGSKTWVDLDGIAVVKKVWGGRANLVEYKAEGPAGKVELLALRWYNPVAGQWSLDFATSAVGKLGIPGVGEFKNGRVDFYDREPINGRSVMVRFSIWGVTPDIAQSEQAFSDDGGKTWEVNWVTKYTRIKNPAG